MVLVDNFKDTSSLSVYELPEGSLILDLKAEIEETEGIPVGHQRLVYGRRDLQDNENLDSLVSGDPSKTIIYLLKPQIYCQVTLRLDTTTKLDANYRGPIKISDLNEPIRASSLMTDWRYRDSLSPELFVFYSDGRPTISIPDIDRSFSYYGVCNGDVINIVCEPRENLTPIRQLVNVTPLCFSDSFPVLLSTGHTRGQDRTTTYTIVQAKHNWDGHIMHPVIKGISLERNALFISAMGEKYLTRHPGWLYGSPVSIEHPEQSYERSFRMGIKGYFPEVFVSPVRETPERYSSDAMDTLEVPPLPPFPFPPATGLTFHFPISDKGHSFLKLTVSYDCISSPVDPTHVTVSLLCTTHDVRRISAVSVFIMIPKSKVLDVQVQENEAHRKEIRTDKEVTENQSKEKHLDRLNIGTHGTTVGFQGGISRRYSFGSTEKGPKVSRRKVAAGIEKKDSIFWNLKAPGSKLDEDGLNGEESITLILKKKPVEFKYKCRVTHARNGVEKTTERMTKTWPWKLF